MLKIINSILSKVCKHGFRTIVPGTLVYVSEIDYDFNMTLGGLA